MLFNRILQKKNISAYKLSKDGGIPYMTVNDLINNKTTLTKCNAETVYKIAKALNLSMEELLEPYLRKRTSFELFKSNICHRLKEKGDIDFILDLLNHNEIEDYYNLEWYPECLYLLAMLDYLSRINNIPICSEYDDYRKLKLSNIVYPSGVLAEALVSHSENPKRIAWDNAIPEFKRFNIVENEVTNNVI